MRTHLAVAVCTVGLSAVACSSSGGGASPKSGTPGSASSPASSHAPAGSAPAGSIALGGAFTGTAHATLCSGAFASIEVKLDGDSQTYQGSISATSFGFVGPDAADYSLKAGQPKPTVSSDKTSFTVKNVTLIDLVSVKTVTANGTITCP